ncbi:Fkbp3 protein [Phlyctochytrium arcticum]|nr:Fkbp3 protein [Phlyctochytrium arcticum]
MTKPEQPWTEDQVSGDDVSKKDVVTFLQEHATYEFLKGRKLYGKVANIAKSAKKPDLLAAYKALYEQDAFRPEGETLEAAAAAATAAAAPAASGDKDAGAKDDGAKEETPKFTKVTTKKGDPLRRCKKGDVVYVFYTGYLPDGTIFDTNGGKKKPAALRFKAGTGRVIKGWDEALLTMHKGEKARVVIESEWAYGKKGSPDGKIPPNTDLTFEIELNAMD